MIKTIISLLTLIGIIFGGYFYIDTRYALAENTRQSMQEISESLQKLNEKIDNTNNSIRYKEIQSRIWKIEEKYEGKKMPDIVKEEYKQLKFELEEMRKK